MVGDERDGVSLENFPGEATSYRAQKGAKGRIRKRGKKETTEFRERKVKERAEDPYRPHRTDSDRYVFVTLHFVDHMHIRDQGRRGKGEFLKNID